MKLKVFILRLLIVFCSFALAFSPMPHGTSGELLRQGDVNQIMSQILDQHITKDKVTPTIIKQSFKVYVDQFDPDKIYLLDEEVSQYTEPSDAFINETLQEYSQGDFTKYHQLEATIRSSIERSRKMRQQMKSQKEQIFSSAMHHRPYRDRGEHGSRNFARTKDELFERLKHDYLEFIEEQKVRYGENKLAKKQERLFKLYEEDLEEQENSYLTYDSEGRPLSEEEQEHRSALHIIKSLAKSLDSHTRFFDDQEAYDMKVRLEKEYEGTGLVFDEGIDGPTIVNLIKNSPAEKNGTIEVDDVLVEVNGLAVADKPYDQVMEMLRGNKGSTVKLAFTKPNGQKYSTELKREQLTVEEDRVVTTYERFGDGIIGTISLKSFYQSPNGISSESDVRGAIQYLRRQGPLRGLILDLRDNSGGYLSQAVKVAGLFITNGVVVISKYNDGEVRYYRDLDGKVSYHGPLIVLVSRGTASAAEIVAQALQDYGVALVVGDPRTYGKGSIQSQTVTDSGSTSFFKVTVGKYYTVSGKTPQIRGVESDIVVPSKLIYGNVGEEFLDFPLAKDHVSAAYNDKLNDVHPEVRGWFLKYYVPTIQKKQALWKGMVGKLKANSEYRVAHNRDYQYFFENPKAGTPNYILSSYHSKPLDVQHQEAISIVKDMFLLQSEMPANETAEN